MIGGMFILFLVLLLLNVPIAFSLGASSLFYLLTSNMNAAVLAQKFYAGIDSFTLLCIPGFTFAGKVIALYIVEGFFVALWSMLFVIPGIIAVYRYSFAIWNLCQNPELGVMEALNRSKRQTIGYKGQLFGLHLSFIGWYLIVFVIVGVYEGVILALMPDSFLGIMLGSLILTVLTGVVDIYLTPYFALSECGFYLRATAPEEPPRQDRSSYTPEF